MTIHAHTTTNNHFGHYFYNEDAIKFGSSDAAAILNFMRYWLGINKKAGRNLKEGRYWTYNSAQDLIKHFPYLSERTISRILKQLVDAGVLIRDNFNTYKYDKTFWYSMPGFEAEPPVQETVAEPVTKTPEITSVAQIRQNGEPIPVNKPLKKPLVTTTSAVENSKPVATEKSESSGSNAEIVFHKAIPKEHRSEIQKRIDKISDVSLQQAILDVLTAAILTGAIRTNPIVYVSALVKSCLNGDFEPAAGYNIAKARETRKEELRKRQIEEQQRAQKPKEYVKPPKEYFANLKAMLA